MIFGLMLATVLLITHLKNKEIECAKNEINAFKLSAQHFSAPYENPRPPSAPYWKNPSYATVLNKSYCLSIER